MKLARTRDKVGSLSGVAFGLSSLFWVGSKSVDGVGRGAVGVLGGPEGFLLQSFKGVERLMHNKTNITARS